MVVDRAVRAVESQAGANTKSDMEFIQELLLKSSIDADIELIKHKLLYACDVTINFHPDRFSNNGKLILENLLADGKYHNQYKTGTSNGGRTAYEGGDRDLWEKRLFCNIYHDGASELISRPKYGALNIHNYLDGASARFGSCFFTLKPHVLERCTFAFGDSSTDPDVMGTSKEFYGIIKAILESVAKKGKLLNKADFTIKDAIEYILSMQKDCVSTIGRNLDDCIETHIHGNLSLSEDVESFYIDEYFIASDIEDLAKTLCERYEIKLRYIPKRQFLVDKIDEKWKGPLARPIAERIDEKFGKNGALNAALIGLASRDSVINPQDWLDLGVEYDLYQNFKYLWHYVAHFG